MLTFLATQLSTIPPAIVEVLTQVIIPITLAYVYRVNTRVDQVAKDVNKLATEVAEIRGELKTKD